MKLLRRQPRQNDRQLWAPIIMTLAIWDNGNLDRPKGIAVTDLTRVTDARGLALENMNDWTGADLQRGLPSRLHMIYEGAVASDPEHPAVVENGSVWT